MFGNSPFIWWWFGDAWGIPPAVCWGSLGKVVFGRCFWSINRLEVVQRMNMLRTKTSENNNVSFKKDIFWVVLSDEQMSNKWPCSLANEQLIGSWAAASFAFVLLRWLFYSWSTWYYYTPLRAGVFFQCVRRVTWIYGFLGILGDS